MIHIFFVAGMFGSMLEMALRAFTSLDGTLEPRFLSDGSSHSFQKQYHPFTRNATLGAGDVKITTPIYPWRDSKLKEIVEHLSHKFPSWKDDHKILIHAPDMKWTEINILFQYHKISVGLDIGLDVFAGERNAVNIKNWNQDYTNYKQMARWEWREWFSIFYPEFVQEWIDAPTKVSDDFLILTNQQILESTKDSLLRLFAFCDLSVVKPIDDFVIEYQRRQSYVIQEFDRINAIIDSVLHEKSLSWEPLSIVGEAILQHRFRCHGFEWYCDGLDVLPTNSKHFQTLIYKPLGNVNA